MAACSQIPASVLGVAVVGQALGHHRRKEGVCWQAHGEGAVPAVADVGGGAGDHLPGDSQRSKSGQLEAATKVVVWSR